MAERWIERSLVTAGHCAGREEDKESPTTGDKVVTVVWLLWHIGSFYHLPFACQIWSSVPNHHHQTFLSDLLKQTPGAICFYQRLQKTERQSSQLPHGVTFRPPYLGRGRRPRELHFERRPLSAREVARGTTACALSRIGALASPVFSLLGGAAVTPSARSCCCMTAPARVPSGMSCPLGCRRRRKARRNPACLATNPSPDG